jgi:hypothetical protein
MRDDMQLFDELNDSDVSTNPRGVEVWFLTVALSGAAIF